MTIGRPRTSYVAAALVGAVATGCGGMSSAHPSSHETFVAAVDRACARAVAAHTGHTFPVKNFDPENPYPDKLPRVADYFDRYGGLPETTSVLHGLTPPARDVARWQALLVIADQITANAQRQITAARAGDVTTFVETVRASNQLTDQLNDAGQRFGFTEKSSCRQVFG
jgi:hypothetical protein